MVSACGCIIRSAELLPLIGEVTISFSDSRHGGFLRLCERASRKSGLAEEGNFHQYVVEFLSTNPNFWELNLRRSLDKLEMMIECCNCEYAFKSQLDAMEYLIHQCGGSFVRPCPCCGEARYFCAARAGQHTHTAHGMDVNLVTSGEMISQFKPREERIKGRDDRKHRRLTTKNNRACIRRAGRAEEEVDVLDISIGGLRFASRNTYLKDEMIEVATHYVAGSMNIFQKARIARIQQAARTDMPGEYGVQFLNGV